MTTAAAGAARSTSPDLPAALRLAEWAVALSPTRHDLALADRALLDTVSVGIAARTHHILKVGAVLGEAGRWAAACHVLDFDDLHMPSTAHISSVCIPPALSTVTGGVTGAAELAARSYLAGAGVMARVGTALGWEHYSAGWHATTTAGALGAAVSAATSRGMDVDGVARAMSLAVPAAGGVHRAFGTDAKSLQVGLAVDAGVRAAELAAAGATTDLTAVEAWMALVGGDPSAITLEGPAVPGGLAIKVYPACYALQRAISAVAGVLPEQVDAASVTRIVVRTPGGTLRPLLFHRPLDGLQGKFSLEYGLAAAILDGHPGRRSFSDAAVGRPAARRLVSLVEITRAEGGDGLLDGQVDVEVHLDGAGPSGAGHATGARILTGSLQYPPGSPQRPPSEAEMLSKVADCLDGTGLDATAITWAGSARLLRATLGGATG